MPIFGKKKTSKYAPKYEHVPDPSGGGIAQEKFSREWEEFKTRLHSKMSGDNPKVDNGEGSKHTSYSDANLRYDREKLCRSYGHPKDRFQNYSVQANRESMNAYLHGIAATGNGRHKVQAQKGTDESPTFGGSTIANVNLQQNSGRITPKRASWAIDHSARHAQPTYVLNRESNLQYVPGGMRQAGAIYHSNPFEAWPNRQDKRNPYHGCQDDGKLPRESELYYTNGKYYRYVNGQYVPA